MVKYTIAQLVEKKIPESLTLDYKRELSYKKELIHGISGFITTMSIKF